MRRRLREEVAEEVVLGRRCFRLLFFGGFWQSLAASFLVRLSPCGPHTCSAFRPFGHSLSLLKLSGGEFPSATQQLQSQLRLRPFRAFRARLAARCGEVKLRKRCCRASGCKTLAMHFVVLANSSTGGAWMPKSFQKRLNHPSAAPGSDHV